MHGLAVSTVGRCTPLPPPPCARPPQVFTMRFSPEGDVIASGSHDKHIFLWRTYGECENYMMLKGAHKNCGRGGGWERY